MFYFGDYTLESGEHRLRRGPQEILLRPRVFDMLLYLLEHRGHLVTKEEVLSALWPDVTVGEATLTHCIFELRQALHDEPSQPVYIKTIPKVGYKFIAEVTELSPTELSQQPRENLEVTPSRSSIAVLPFKDMSSEKDQEYFCEGIAEEIINALTKVEGLRVVARTSAFCFKGKTEDIRDIGEKLNAQVVLEGSVRRSGDQLRISVQLLNAASGYHLWSEQYDRSVGDIFAVQGDIAVKVVDKLNIGIAGSRKAAILKHHTENLEAYHLYLKGRYFWSKESGEELQKAADYYRSAIAEDPEYALAYAGLSTCYFIMWTWDYLPPAQTLVEGKRAALKAVEIDESLGASHSALGLIRLAYDWDWQDAHRCFVRAIELSPGDVYSHTGYAVYFMAIGEMDQAIAECNKALEIDPLSPQAYFYLGMFLLRAGLPEEAACQFREALELEPDQPQARWLLGQALVLASDYREGIQEIETALQLSGQTPMILAGLGWAYGVSGRERDAYRVLRILEDRSQDEHIRPYLFAKVFCGMGEKDKAFAWLLKAYEERDTKLAFVKTDETLTGLRSDARFKTLMRKMGLPDTI